MPPRRRRPSAEPTLRPEHARVAQEGTTVSDDGPERGVAAEELDRLPLDPGVYLFKDRGGTVIYVGKAKSLRTRVRQYFRPGHCSRKAA